MIYDCFQFNNELDLLEIRLNHHSKFVDKFIITECPWTYSGIKKRLYFNEVKDKPNFAKFKNKIIHRIYNVPPNGLSNWDYEHKQRNYLRDVDFDLDDLIVYTDCDEIIRNKAVIIEALENNRIITLDMKLCWYYFNCVIKPDSKFQTDYSMEACFNHRWRMAKIFKPDHLWYSTKNVYQLRQLFLWDLEHDYTIKNAGWHFSNLGDPDLIYKKFCSFSHSNELNSKYYLSKKAIANRKQNLQDPLGRNVSFVQTDLDVPKFVTDNIQKYKRYIINVSNS